MTWLGVGLQRRAILASDRRSDGDEVGGQRPREGHPGLGLVGGVPEHDPLIAGALDVALVERRSDLLALPTEEDFHVARIGIDVVLDGSVSDIADRGTDDGLRLVVHVPELAFIGRSELAGDEDLSGRDGLGGERAVKNRHGDPPRRRRGAGARRRDDAGRGLVSTFADEPAPRPAGVPRR